MQQHLLPAIRIADRLADRQPHNREITSLRYHLRLLGEALRVLGRPDVKLSKGVSNELPHKKIDWAGYKRRQRARKRATASPSSSL